MGLLDIFNRRENRVSAPMTPAATAKERLQVALISDRVKLSPEMLEMIKEEIITVIGKYVEIDRDAMEVAWGENRDRLTATIPVVRHRTTGRARRSETS